MMEILHQLTVRLRRGPGWKVKPSSEQLDGNTYTFHYGWPIEDDETAIYQGEDAWLVYDLTDYPKDAPIWLASGDLIGIPATH